MTRSINKRFGWRGLVALLAPVFLVSSNGLPRTELAFAQAAIARVATPAPKPAWPVQALAALNYLSGGGPVGGGWLPVSPVSNASGHYAEEIPSVAYNSLQQEYLVVWQQADGSGNTAIYGRRVSRSGALVGSVLPISPAFGVNRYPDVAYDSAHNNYLVVYEVEGAGIYGQRVGGDGGLVGSEFCIVSEIGFALHEPAIAYATTAAQYLVTWQRVQGVWQGIAARTVPGTGTTPGSVLDITGLIANELVHPDVAYNSARDQFLVVWQQWFDSTYRYDIRGRRIDMDGGAHLEGGIIDILFSTDDEMNPAVGAVAQPADVGKYLVVCQRYYPGGFTIDGQLVTAPWTHMSGSAPLLMATMATSRL